MINYIFKVDDELTIELKITEEVANMNDFDKINYILKELRHKTDNLFYKYRNFKQFGQIDEGVLKL